MERIQCEVCNGKFFLKDIKQPCPHCGGIQKKRNKTTNLSDIINQI